MVDKVEFTSIFLIVPRIAPVLMGDVADVIQKMFPFNATVPNVSPSLLRRCFTDGYDHVDTRL